MGELNNERDIINRFQQLKEELNALATKFNDIESQAQEHEGVIKALEPLDNSRKCFRLIGGVLVERTVAEVQPAVKSNCEQLRLVRTVGTCTSQASQAQMCRNRTDQSMMLQIATTLEKQVRNKEKEVINFQEKYKIRMKGEGDQDTAEQNQSKAAGAGVLVSKQ